MSNIIDRIRVAIGPKLVSTACSQSQLSSVMFQNWVIALREPPMSMHRKLWEYAFISQALAERGMLRPGRRGLGFAVGQEPLPAAFAARGSYITATDLSIDEARLGGWVDSDQHATGLEKLNSRGLCPNDKFRKKVDFLAVDMRSIPSDLTGYDFLWSSCSLEHLGSLALGRAFIVNSLACLKPGGVAVHTTEFNVSSNDSTLIDGHTVLFRRRDIEEIGHGLLADGHRIRLDFNLGSAPADLFVNMPPYTPEMHLRLDIDGYTATSYGMIIRKARRPPGSRTIRPRITVD